MFFMYVLMYVAPRNGLVIDRERLTLNSRAGKLRKGDKGCDQSQCGGGAVGVTLRRLGVEKRKMESFRGMQKYREMV